ncbi:MAG: NusG-like protein [Terriglobia bacterium]|nr:MAG: NusG-like protein [Terriglobia bacterium]
MESLLEVSDAGLVAAVNAFERGRGWAKAAPLPWYAVRVKSNFEWVTATMLRDKGFQEFLPVYRAKVRWSDRVKETEKPLFPGYVFCRFEAEQKLPIISTPGVVQVVGVGKQPVPIDDQEMDAIRKVVRSGGPSMPWPYLQVGERVLVEKGPLKGMEGILVQVKSKCRIVVTISLLHRGIAAEVERDWVRPVPGSPSSSSHRI